MGSTEPADEHAQVTIAEKEMAWLTHEQITELLYDCQRQSTRSLWSSKSA